MQPTTTTGSRESNSTLLRRQINRLIRSLERSGFGAASHGLASDLTTGTKVLDSRARLSEMLKNDVRLQQLHSLSEADLEGLCLELARLCVEGRLQQTLAEADIPYPIYNFFASFDENSRGPWGRVPIVPETPSELRWELFGIPVRFPIGVPASGLTQNREWVEYFAHRGFNILTYKTVRSSKHDPHCHPHWVFVEDIEPWKDMNDISTVHGDLDTWPKSLSRFSTANSFGVPSQATDVWQKDVERTLKRIANGQLLIVSVMGTVREGEHDPRQAMIQDFVAVARSAEETGVKVIELNLSCPNTVLADHTSGMAPPISSDPATTRDVVLAVRAGLHHPETKLVAKLGCETDEVLTEIVSSVGSMVDGISGINTVQATILKSDGSGTPFVGTSEDPQRARDKAGVSGTAIRELGISFVSRLNKLRTGGGYGFSIIGMGGVMSVEDVDAYLDAGADAVQSATGACLNPDLPFEIDDWSKYANATSEVPRRKPTRFARVADVMASGGYSLLSNRNGGSG
jgi:dihydroorotate dehydrogenase